ncbi:MAG: AsmA family protein, partial [Acidobacteriaceae bacterium]|nr:AsmA family protein [Acidobacteriaceae bacterium]
MKSRKGWRRPVLAGIAIAATLVLIAPLINANGLRAQIENALESALNRHVTVGRVRFTLWTGPAVTVNDVLIDEAPGMGIEPFAHVETLQARIRLASLWHGRWLFSNLTLSEPSVNFVKSSPNGAWNVQPLLNRARLVNPDPRAPVPQIQIRDGRLNFKFGNTKSVFYIDSANLDVYLNADGKLIVRFEGEPARTDHAAQGLGHLVARGSLSSTPGSDDQLSMSVQLERTSLQELARLFDIQDIGVRGFAASNLKLDGPLSKLAISGDLRIEEIHRWDLLPNRGEGWTLNYAGFLDVPAQKLDIETRSPGQHTSPVNGKLIASDYLTSPQWQATLTLDDLPAADLMDTARRVGAVFPNGAKLDGSLNGQIEYSRGNGLTGDLVVNRASFQLPQGSVTEFASAPVEIRNNAVKIGPADITFEGGQSAQIEASYALDARKLYIDLETKLLSVAHTKALAMRMLNTGSVALLDRCTQGVWRGKLSFEQTDEGPGHWTGDFDLQNAHLDVPGFAAPLRVSSVSVLMQAEQVVLSRLHGRAGTIAFDGDYRYYPRMGRPDRARLFLSDVDLPELEQILAPALSRQQGFLARAFRLSGNGMPEWLRTRNIDAFFQAKNVHFGDASLGSVRTRLVWAGSNIELSGLQTKRDRMEGVGSVSVDLADVLPRYLVSGRL